MIARQRHAVHIFTGSFIIFACGLSYWKCKSPLKKPKLLSQFQNLVARLAYR